MMSSRACYSIHNFTNSCFSSFSRRLATKSAISQTTNAVASDVFRVRFLNYTLGGLNLQQNCTLPRKHSRFFSSSTAHHIASRLGKHFDNKTPNEMYKMAIEAFRQFDPSLFESLDSNLENNLSKLSEIEKLNFVLKIIEKLAFMQKQEIKINTNSRWVDYDISNIEMIPGFTNRFSSTSFHFISEVLPKLIPNLYPNVSPSIIEIGGFCHNDAFLLMHKLTKEKINVASYIGIDIFYKGILAAQLFNQAIAKISHMKFIHDKADTGLEKLSFSDDRNNRILIAVRFLSAIEPSVMEEFFSTLKKTMKAKDLFIFDYTVDSEEALKVVHNQRFLLSKEGGLSILKKADDKSTHLQTFFKEELIKDLIVKNGLTLINQHKVDGSVSGTKKARGQLDPYHRVVVASLKV